MADIVPDLYKKILSDFNTEIKRAKSVRDFKQKIERGTASMEDASLYASDLGDIASEVLLKNITEEMLPDGALYWNIASRTIKPLLEVVHSMVNDAAIKVQKIQDKKLRINIKAIAAEFPEDRVNELLNKIVIVTANEQT